MERGDRGLDELVSRLGVHETVYLLCMGVYDMYLWSQAVVMRNGKIFDYYRAVDVTCYNDHLVKCQAPLNCMESCAY